LSRKKKLIFAGAGVFLAALVAFGIVLLVISRSGHGPVSPFPTAATTELPSPGASSTVSPSANPNDQGSWPTYGFDDARTRFDPAVTLKPPYRILWNFRANDLLEFPPVFQGDRLYFNGEHGRVRCLDAATGKELWHFDTKGKIASSPTVSGGVVYVTSLRGYLFALDATTGHALWNYRLGGPSECSPLIWRDRVVVGAWDGAVYAIDIATRKLAWHFQTGGKVTGSPALLNDRLVIGSYSGSVFCLNYDGRRIWRFHASRFLIASDQFYATPALAYDTAYVGSIGSAIYAIDLQTGNQRWVTHTGSWVYSSPAVWQRFIYEGSYDHKLYALDAATGRVRWTFDAGRPISGSPTVLNGVVYFSSLGGHTWGLDARSGKVVWSIDDGRYTPVTAGRTMLFLCGHRSLYGLVAR
jgi:outer membrane protein assembly factor BamB